MDVSHKIPEESPAYPEWSKYALARVSGIMKASIDQGRNQIVIRTNLKRGLPLENINKVAGPFVEAWALEQFESIAEDPGNRYELVNVEAGQRLDMIDIVLQFKRHTDNHEYISAHADVKATAEDISTSGRSPNITSFARIRTEYITDPDYIFMILSLKHKVYGDKDRETGLTHGIMEVVSFAVYDLKYVSSADISYNPALGTGQLQIRDIHYVGLQQRTTWEFLQLLDQKCIRSRGEDQWLVLARKYGWIKENESNGMQPPYLR